MDLDKIRVKLAYHFGNFFQTNVHLIRKFFLCFKFYVLAVAKLVQE